MNSISKSLLLSVLGPAAVGSVSLNGRTPTLRKVAEMDFDSPAVSTFVTGQNAELLQTYFVPTRGPPPGSGGPPTGGPPTGGPPTGGPPTGGPPTGPSGKEQECPSTFCVMVYDPVCGSDGVKYSNSCVMASKTTDCDKPELASDGRYVIEEDECVLSESGESGGPPTGGPPTGGPPTGPTTPKYGISRVANVNDVFDGITSTPVHEIITNDVVWPNEAKPLPSDTIIGLDDAYIYSGGFFAAIEVTGFDPDAGRPILTQLPGDVAIFRKGPQNTVEKVQLTKSIPNDPSFYHKTAFMDCNGDGKMDIVTARTYVEFGMRGPAIDDARTEMLCLMQPENWDSDEWTEHLIVSGGPGVAFELTDFNKDGKKEILASEFFVNQQLSIYKCEKEAWTLCSEDDLVIEVLDNANGRYFHVSTADLDGDGDEDIVATTSPHARGAPLGGQVWAYENEETKTCEYEKKCFYFICLTLPTQNCRYESKWIQHELTDKFEVLDPQGANGTPGDVHAFHPVRRGDNKGKIPYLLLSGDDGGFTAVLEPKGTRKWNFNWEYTVNKFITGEQTFGAPAVAYVNDDRYADIVVPEFSANKVHFFTYAPAN